MEDGKYVEQFKTVDDIRDVINTLIEEYRNAKKGKVGVLFRVKVPPNSSTLYKEGHQGNFRLVQGVRVGDYTFDKNSNFEWVLEDREAGLSFSKTFSHLKGKQKMLSKHAMGYQKPGPADVAWWILESNELPDGMEFVRDPDDRSHYFLAVTRRMHISKLVENLKFISFRMNLAKDISFGV